MLLIAAILLLLALLGLAGFAGALLVLRRGTARIAGGALLAQVLLALAALAALCTIPVGIGNPFIRLPARLAPAEWASSIAVLAAAGVLSFLAGRWLRRWLSSGGGARPAAIAALLAVPVIAAASMAGLVYASTPARERERDPSKRTIELAPGFQWNIFVQGTIDNPTTITFGPDGKLYIADISGALWVATDADHDGRAEDVRRFAGGFELLVGLAWHGDELFAASSGKIEALRDSNGDGVADQRRLVVDGLPSMILKPHSNNGIAFGPDGRLYFGVGSTTNDQFETNELAAAILSVKPDGSDLRVVARGLGNSFDLAFNDRGELFAGDNSPIGAEDEAPDEFNQIIEGQHYGFPYFYGDPPDRSTRGPLISFPPHSVPTGVTFYSGQRYPRVYQGTAFTTLWNLGELVDITIEHAPDGTVTARETTFGSGFLYPIDVITGPDGNLYVADFGTSVIYRITYTGGQE
jgi:putative membrane-bound dehydrogenase-like protein